jgi:ATP adenylyltransferase
MKRRKKPASKALRRGDRKESILWAPWRLEYILDPHDGPLSAKEKACVFCHHENPVSETKDREALVLARGRTCYTILNKFPYSNGHLMVVPYAHIGEFTALTPETLQEMMTRAQSAVVILQKNLGAAGFNIGMNLGRVSGAGIPGHLHIHVVPRWNGDNNFMPIIGHTRVLPEYIEKTYDRLIAAFRDNKA